jgi:hypothetical protein
MNKERAELSELSQAFASEIGKLEKVIADVGANPNPDKSDPATLSQITSCMNAIYSVASNLHNRMDRMQASMWNYQDSHAAGHLPPCPSTEHMAVAIKNLGWDKNYEVKKKQIEASKDLFQIKKITG